MPRSLESDRLYEIPTSGYIIKATIAKEALSIYGYNEHPVFFYSGGIHAATKVKEILKRLRKDSKPGYPPVARKVA
jgi:hypothetical protein